LGLCVTSIAWRLRRGRDASYLAPPAQIRTCSFPAYGSHLGYQRQFAAEDVPTPCVTLTRLGNPAELLIAALSACHQLWYLHLCADAGIVVVAYSDDASGVGIEQADGAGQFESVTLRPHAKLAAGSDENIARSVSFKVEHKPTFEIASA
jgi:hypothetical protein